MRARRHATVAAALLASAVLAIPAQPPTWTLLGFTLPLTKRDFRVFNNFSDPQANDNAVADPNFPGATGAVMAIWKAAVEWGSRRHGPGGAGDPTQGALGGNPLFGTPGQPEALANFDFTYQGLAASPGGFDDSIVSVTQTPLGPGVLAITLSPDAGGCMILFDDTQWVWEDGPGAIACTGTSVDIQGVAAHQLGHALGLGHTFVLGATMQPTIDCAGSIARRSIEAPDVGGVRAAYGDASLPSSTKPVVTGIAGTFSLGGVIAVAGMNFDPAANEVWFTSENGGPPRIVGAIPSIGGGTQISLTIPMDAPLPRSGDLLVRVPGTGHDRLSNAWPIDVPPPPSLPPTLLSVSPSPVDLVALPQPVLTLTGSNLSQVTSVAIGPATVTPPYLVQSPGVIQLALPILPLVGPVGVQVANPFGTSSAVALTVEPATPPVLLTQPPIGGTGVPFTAEMYTVPGDLVVLAFSPSNLPSAVPGLVSLGLGNGFALLFTFPPLVASPMNGAAPVSFLIPPGGAGYTVYWQFVSIPPTLVPPFPASNLTSIFLFF
ncbi:MAG: matrixin family metalloprotease [Planctomycetes bacterium]|nr:matrixin family metalloprotease [Planctomycetota bacterium]